MARLGKILVFVHTGLSLCLAAWALALWTNRIDWTDRKASADKPAGLLAQRRAEYERTATSAVRPADLRVRTNHQLLVFHEAWRPAEKAWFEQELAHLRTGDVSKKPIRQVIRGPDGFPIGPETVTPPDLVQMQWPFTYKERMDPKDPKSPFAEPAKPRKDRAGKDLALNTFSYYRTEIDGVLKDQDKAAKRIEDAAKKEKEYTDDLKGVPPEKKGRHAELRDEYVKLAMIEAEYNELRPQWLNNKVELQNLEELRDRLNERILQLGGKPAGERRAGN
ncbi:MAG: hypothetical protein HYS12_03940 [Planctomycetes bacterium]|nr:hypothetical protein [Planctomycetota bacterium]